jgi:hypothetical protein
MTQRCVSGVVVFAFGLPLTQTQGESVSLSNDGHRVAIGAQTNDGTGNNAGHARVYDVGTLHLVCTWSCTTRSHTHVYIYIYIGVGVAIERHTSQADPATDSPIVFSVQFTEDTADFETGDVTVTSTSGEPLIGVVESVSGSLPDNAYTVSVAVTLSGAVTASIAAGVANDADNIPNFASTSIDNQIVFDKIGVLIDDIVAIEAKLDDKTQCRDV